MARTQGRVPNEHHTVEAKTADGSPVSVKMPICNYCGAKMFEISLPTLTRIAPNPMRHPHKYPFIELAAICVECRTKEGMGEKDYLLVPVKPGTNYEDALRAELDEMGARRERLRIEVQQA